MPFEKISSRRHLGLSQSEMKDRINFKDDSGRISDYELGKRHPTVLTFLSYARVAGIHVNDLVDDDIELQLARAVVVVRKPRARCPDRPFGLWFFLDGASLLSMRRFVVHFSMLVLTFAIGTYANVLVNRAAHSFIPDVDPQPVTHCVLRASLAGTNVPNSRFQISD